MKKISNLIWVFLLWILVLVLFYLLLNWIIIYNYYINLSIILLLSIAWIIHLSTSYLEQRKIKWQFIINIEKKITISLSLILSTIFVWQFWITLLSHNWYYPKWGWELLETKCVNEKCVDIYYEKIKFKWLNYLNLYYYNKNNSIIKYKWIFPSWLAWNDLKWDYRRKAEVIDLVQKANFSIKDWNYILDYTGLQWEKESLIINH